MLPAALSSLGRPNVVRLALPVRVTPTSTHDTLDQPEGNLLLTTAAQAWQLQLELAWSYPRLCYALWSRLMTMPSRPDAHP